jgi:hypothetical protein
MLPELQAEIVGAESPMSLWIDIICSFDEAYEEPRNESLIRRVYEYADWCLYQKGGEIAAEHLPTCVATCFWEHIPTNRAARDDMPRWVSFGDVIVNEHFFGRLITEEEFERLKRLYQS